MTDSLAIILIIGGLIYFLPSIIALARQSPDRTNIALLNLFASWSIIAWLAALIWSLKQKEE